MPLCGDFGHMTKAGVKCGQGIPAGSAGCLWHRASPEERKLLSMEANAKARMKKALPLNFQVAAFDDEDDVIGFARVMAQKVLTTDVDPRRVDVSLRAASVAMAGFAAKTQRRLVDAIATLEHGGAAMLLLTRLTEGLTAGKRKALPGMAKVLEAVATLPPEETNGT